MRARKEFFPPRSANCKHKRLPTYFEMPQGSQHSVSTLKDHKLNLKMTDNSLSKIPYCDEEAEIFCVYVSNIKAYAKFMGIGDALDPILMTNCPTLLELQ